MKFLMNLFSFLTMNNFANISKTFMFLDFRIYQLINVSVSSRIMIKQNYMIALCCNIFKAKGESLLASLLKDEKDKMMINPEIDGLYPSKICDNSFCMKYILFGFFVFCFLFYIVDKILRLLLK